MFRFKELLEKNHDELARLITREHGKVFEDAKGEVVRASRWSSSPPHPAPAQGRILGAGLHRHRPVSLRQPLGVCAGITPFNFPAWCRCGCIPSPSPAATPSC